MKLRDCINKPICITFENDAEWKECTNYIKKYKLDKNVHSHILYENKIIHLQLYTDEYFYKYKGGSPKGSSSTTTPHSNHL